MVTDTTDTTDIVDTADTTDTVSDSISCVSVDRHGNRYTIIIDISMIMRVAYRLIGCIGIYIRNPRSPAGKALVLSANTAAIPAGRFGICARRVTSKMPTGKE